MRILPNISGHDDLQRLTEEEQILLCQEIRQYLVNSVAKTGGHLASNLGIVELTVAIETVFNTEKDRLVFDVGHQSYVHKLLTGRQNDFENLRQYGGISGFPKPNESQTDAFVAGHASSSVSIALGMARARTLLKDDYQVVAVLGDGAATGGMIYEGMNDAAMSKEPMVIILNDNEMSIDKNVGGMAWHLSRIRSSGEYLRLKAGYRRIMMKNPTSKSFYQFTSKVKNRIKRLVLPSTIFENMGLTYLGPVDGHNLPELIELLRMARDLRSPVLVHVMTRKGYGYKFAEQKPSKFHGIGKFNPETGKVLSPKTKTYSDAFGDALIELATENPKVCAITAAMPGGTGLLEYRDKFPNRLFDVGIAEEHAVSMAGGLAKQGMIPVVAIYSTFLQRSYDQMMQDVALLGLHVVFAIDRAGLVGEDGPTHHGVFDVGYLRQIPGMMVLTPSNFFELRTMLRWAVEEYDGPVAVRYPRGNIEVAPVKSEKPVSAGLVQTRQSGEDVTLIGYGTLVTELDAAAQLLQENGIHATVLQLYSVSHYSRKELVASVRGKHVFIVEEITSGSGISGEIAMCLQEGGCNCNVHSIDLGKDFVPHGSMSSLYKLAGIDAAGICNSVKEVLGHEN